MNAFKKMASLVIASSMLLSAVPMAMADGTTSLADKAQAYIKAELSEYNVDTRSADLVLDADTDVAVAGTGKYGDSYISKAASSKKVAEAGEVSLTGDFISTLDMTKVQNAFKAYQAAAAKMLEDNDALELAILKAALDTTPVTGTFTINVVYDARMQMSDETKAYHTTNGSMNGFNDEAKRIFGNDKRELMLGKVVLADNTVVDNAAYNTLQIKVDVVAPPAEYTAIEKSGDFADKLVYADLDKYTAELLGDISYKVDGITVSEAYSSNQYYTESISMSGSINILDTISTINFSTKQLDKNANNYKDVEDWEKISATMALRLPSSGGGGGGGTFVQTTATPKPVPTATPDPSATIDPNATMDPNTPSSTIPPYTPADNKVPSVLNGDDHYVYIIGYPEGDVRPEGNITREEVATIFYRILKDEFRDTIYTKNHNYSDVELSRWSNKAIATLTNGGFIQGYGDDANTFKPAGDMTRLEFIVMATNFLDESDSEVKYLDDVKFTDVPGRLSWGQEALQKAAIAELIDEDERTNFRPEEKIKRHEAMKVINRLLVRNVKEDGLIDGYVQWPDNPKDAKYYYEVIEATNSHTFERLEDGYEKWTSVDQNWIWGEFKTQYEDPDEIDKQ